MTLILVLGAVAWSCGDPLLGPQATSIAASYLRLFRDVVLGAHVQWDAGMIDGSRNKAWINRKGFSSIVHAMAGVRRIDHAVALVASAVQDCVPGDVLEAGVWRGGTSFTMAKALQLLSTRSRPHSRRHFLVDSFRGIPEASEYGARGTRSKANAQDRVAHKIAELNANDATAVQAQAARLGLDLARTVRFRVGFFNESLSALLREEPALRLSVLRMDGDTYASTMETLELMYDRVSPGGFVIADDYLDWEGCRAAVHEFRAARNISEPIVLTPHSPEPQGPHLPGAPPEILRSVYWRKGGAGAPLPDCVGAPAGALRITGSYNPGRLRCVSEVGRPLRAPAGLALSKAATTHPIRPTSARELLHMCEP